MKVLTFVEDGAARFIGTPDEFTGQILVEAYHARLKEVGVTPAALPFETFILKQFLKENALLLEPVHVDPFPEVKVEPKVVASKKTSKPKEKPEPPPFVLEPVPNPEEIVPPVE